MYLDYEIHFFSLKKIMIMLVYFNIRFYKINSKINEQY